MKSLKLLFLLVFLGGFFQGCIRLTGHAGYWHQGPEDEEPKIKEVGF